MNQTRRIILHVIADWTAATLSWLGLFLFRKSFIEASKHGYEIPVNHDDNLLLGLLLVPFFGFYFTALAAITTTFSDVLVCGNFNTHSTALL